MRRAIVSIALALVVVVVFFAGWLFWGSWISPMEKRAMNVALDRIDEAGRCEDRELAVCEQELQTANAAILVCRKKELTAYDKQLVQLLDLQLAGAKTEQRVRMGKSTDTRYARQLAVVEDLNHQTEAMLRTHLR